MDEREAGAKNLTVLPGEIVNVGGDAIRKYFADRRASKLLLEIQDTRHQVANVNEQIGKHGTNVDTQLDRLNDTIAVTTNATNALVIGKDYFEAYPSLWTLEYQRDGPRFMSKFVLKIRSYVSGKCFHDPIEITVPNQLLVDCGVIIKVRLSDA